MTHRILHGICLDVISPSFYRVTEWPVIDIAFVGHRDGQRDGWLLSWPNEEGEPAIFAMPTLDACAQTIADALAVASSGPAA